MVLAWSPASCPSALGSEPAAEGQSGVQSGVRVCKIRFTEMGKRATFRVTLRYRLTTGSSGQVSQVERVGTDERASAFIDPESLSSCLRTWVLDASGVYDVSVQVGSPGHTIYEIFRQGKLWLHLVDTSGGTGE